MSGKEFSDGGETGQANSLFFEDKSVAPEPTPPMPVHRPPQEADVHDDPVEDRESHWSEVGVGGTTLTHYGPGEHGSATPQTNNPPRKVRRAE